MADELARVSRDADRSYVYYPWQQLEGDIWVMDVVTGESKGSAARCLDTKSSKRPAEEGWSLLGYGNDMAKPKLRIIIQNHADVAYIFLGSKKHLIQGTFLDRSRPL